MKDIIEIITEFFISILIVACIIVLLSILFYDKISLSKVIPESEEYLISEEIQKELQETNIDMAEEVVVNYYIDAGDLKKYEKTNEYVKGKSNPFAEASTSPSEGENDIINSNNNSSSIENSNKNESTNFYEDDGTK